METSNFLRGCARKTCLIGVVFLLSNFNARVAPVGTKKMKSVMLDMAFCAFRILNWTRPVVLAASFAIIMFSFLAFCIVKFIRKKPKYFSIEALLAFNETKRTCLNPGLTLLSNFCVLYIVILVLGFGCFNFAIGNPLSYDAFDETVGFVTLSRFVAKMAGKFSVRNVILMRLMAKFPMPG